MQTKIDIKNSATSPLSRRHSEKNGSLDYEQVVTAAAETLGIGDTLPHLCDTVKPEK